MEFFLSCIFSVLTGGLCSERASESEERITACHCRGRARRCSHLHIKAQVLLLFKEEVQHKLPDKVGVQRVIDHLRPTELEGRQRGEESQRRAHPHSCAFAGRNKLKLWLLLLQELRKTRPSDSVVVHSILYKLHLFTCSQTECCRVVLYFILMSRQQ